MTTVRYTLMTAALCAAMAATAASQAPVQHSMLHDYRVVKVVDSLIRPWSMAFLPNGDMLVTEKPGRLRIVRKGKLLPAPVEGVPAVFTVGQAGLLDVVPHPNFASNKLIYLSFSKPVGDSASTTAVVRGRFDNDRLTNIETIFEAQTRGRGHYGSRLAFDRNNYLFITTGDRQAPPSGNLETHPAQDLTNHHGKISRLHDDGKVPTDNPFVGRSDAKPEIWSYGHRNMQGLAIHPVTGDLWETEHGPQGGDELNLIKSGANYGWPVIGYGVNYGSGSTIHVGTMRAGMENPVNVWVPSIGTSGLLFYTGDKFPEWKGNLFAGGMVGQQLARIVLNGQRAEVAEILVRRQGRIRDVRQGPDGFIYLAIDHEQSAPTPILRIEPVARN